ncbi:MAG: thermonuclease family protein [Rhodospirillales bacterium]|nr:thermonuclease family protein [Rhodospirillales bacterium]
MARFAVVFLLILTVTAAGAASEPVVPLPAGLALDTKAKVVEVIDGSTVMLDDGETVRLAGIETPKHITGDAASGMELLAETARQRLARLVQGRRVGLAVGGTPRDRYGRLRAHMVRSDDGTWIQGALLAAGLARVHSLVDDRAAAAEMHVIERRARAAGLGIWSQPRYRVRTADQADDGLHNFQLVEGRVRAAAVVRGRGYLNFGDDWRQDFTVSIAPRDRRRFETADIAIEDYEGRLVRVRGWVHSFNGPMIEATHPEQIEVLE